MRDVGITDILHNTVYEIHKMGIWEEPRSGRSLVDAHKHKFTSASNAARGAGYSTRHIRHLLQTGRVRGIKAGGTWLTTESDVSAYAAAIRQQKLDK